MRSARFRVMAELAGAALCFFAAASNAQNTNTPATIDPTAQTAAPTTTAQPTNPAPDASVSPSTNGGTTTDGSVTRSTATDVQTTTGTTTTTTSFPGGFLGILAVAVLVIVALFAMFRGRDSTVVRDSYTSTNTTNTAPPVRTTSTGTASRDATLDSRAASGTTTTTTRIDDSRR